MPRWPEKQEDIERKNKLSKKWQDEISEMMLHFDSDFPSITKHLKSIGINLLPFNQAPFIRNTGSVSKIVSAGVFYAGNEALQFYISEDQKYLYYLSIRGGRQFF